MTGEMIGESVGMEMSVVIIATTATTVISDEGIIVVKGDLSGSKDESVRESDLLKSSGKRGS